MSIFYNKAQKVNPGDTGGLKLWRLMIHVRTKIIRNINNQQNISIMKKF